MNRNFICVLDYETCSANSYRTQPTQISACMIDGRRLEIPPGAIFNSFVKTVPDNECEEFGLNKIEEKALEKTKITRKQIEEAPSLKVVWSRFIEFVNKYNIKKNKWDAPVIAGFNNNRFDDIITNRICGGNQLYNPTFKEPYKFGPWDDENRSNKLFHPRDNIDLMKILFSWFENDKDINSYSLDNMRPLFGIDTEGAHNAKVDVLQTGFLLIKFLKLHRYVYNNVGAKFRNSFAKENQMIKELLNA